jgi:hypothetical protein
MKRRDALAALAATPAAAQDLAVTHPEAIAQPALHFFTPAEMSLLRQLAAKVVPSLDGRPGAVEAGAPEFLDFLLSRSAQADQHLYRQGLAAKPSLALLEQPWTYAEPSQPSARFLRRLKEDLLRATFNSREWAGTRRGAGTGYYWKAFD